MGKYGFGMGKYGFGMGKYGWYGCFRATQKSAPNPRDHDLDSDDDPSSNNHVLAI